MGDNQCLLQSLKDSPYYAAFEDKAKIWETRLADLDEFILNLNQIQRKWLYLEPIFARGALPKEQARCVIVVSASRAHLMLIIFTRDFRTPSHTPPQVQALRYMFTFQMILRLVLLSFISFNVSA